MPGITKLEERQEVVTKQLERYCKHLDHEQVSSTLLISAIMALLWHYQQLGFSELLSYFYLPACLFPFLELSDLLLPY